LENLGLEGRDTGRTTLQTNSRQKKGETKGPNLPDPKLQGEKKTLLMQPAGGKKKKGYIGVVEGNLKVE